MRNAFLIAMLALACDDSEVLLDSPQPLNDLSEPQVGSDPPESSNDEDLPQVDADEPQTDNEVDEHVPPQINTEVEVTREFEFNVPDNTRLIQDGFAAAKCDTCEPEYVFAFDGLMDVPSNGTIVKEVLYDMIVIVDPVDVGRYPQTFVQAVELSDGRIQVVDNINDEWTGTWITNAARVDTSTGHTFLFVVNVNLQTEDAARYMFRTLLSGFRVVRN